MQGTGVYYGNDTDFYVRFSVNIDLVLWTKTVRYNKNN